jgi:DNA helicase-2/ATP-dependent DNA helicase PcrA
MDEMPDPILDPLNPEQRVAVTHGDGPLLILAGAGSGKTRVLTHRVAYLIRDLAVPANAILAVTFTNKAAKEMRERLDRLVGTERLGELTVGTFHAFCARLLRREGPLVGIDRSFAIYDEADQRAVLRQAMGDTNASEKVFAPGAISNVISSAKNELKGPADLTANPKGQLDRIAAIVWKRYDELLRENNAVDFDDLLLLACRVFETSDRALEKWQDRYQHILVDEYQDTNRAQYVLLRYLAGFKQNLAVVGDDDQSVFSWRGADVRNILDFERDYPNAKVVKLEQNYRSTQRILDAAHAVVRNNAKRKEKKLWTDRLGGSDVVVMQAYDESHEAELVAREIERLQREGEAHGIRDVAVLYRTNAQSRAIEDTFRAFGLAYQIVGGVSFYQRREVKDTLAYLRLIGNPHDAFALARVLNTPPRGLGDKTRTALLQSAREQEQSVGDALAKAELITTIPRRQQDALIAFGKVMSRLRESAQQLALPRLIDDLVSLTGYEKYLKDGTEEGEERWANVQELRTLAEDYVNLPQEEQLPSFLEEIALVSDVDEYKDAKPAATLIEEGVFPHIRAIDSGSEAELEEERRLCYVGITRAKDRAYLTYARRRSLFGHTNMNPPSRFLMELPSEGVELRGNIETEERDSWAELDWERDRTRYEERKQARRDAMLAGLPAAWSGRATKQRTAVVSETRFRAGDRVVHPSLGEGMVVSSVARDDDEEVTVAFPDKGVKKLMASFAKLARAEGTLGR